MALYARNAKRWPCKACLYSFSCCFVFFPSSLQLLLFSLFSRTFFCAFQPSAMVWFFVFSLLHGCVYVCVCLCLFFRFWSAKRTDGVVPGQDLRIPSTPALIHTHTLTQVYQQYGILYVTSLSAWRRSSFFPTFFAFFFSFFFIIIIPFCCSILPSNFPLAVYTVLLGWRL